MKHVRSIALAAILTAALAAPAHAALTWNNAGPTNNWSTAVGNGNWLPGNVVWTNGEDAIFDAPAEAGVTVTTANTVDDITFNASWTIGNGAGSLTLADATSVITVTNLADNATISESISGSGFGITKEGAGKLTLAGANNYTGATIINAGTLTMLRATTNTTSGFVVNTGGTLDYNSNGATWAAPNNPVSLNGGTLSFSASGIEGRYLTGGPTTTVDAASFITVQSLGGATVAPNNSNFFLDNGLKGSADVTVTSSTNGLGLVLRSAASTYSGHVTVNGNVSATPDVGGGMAIDPTVLMSSADFTVNGTLEIGGGAAGMSWASSATTGLTVSIDALGGGGIVVANFATSAKTRTLSLGNNNGSGSFSGSIAAGTLSTLSLIKNGTGTQILSGVNGYTGTTAVNAGELLVTGTGSLASSQVNVALGAAVGGSGTINNNLALGDGNFVFDLAYVDANALTVNGTFTWNSTFGVDNLVAADGSAVNWLSVADGVYTLLVTGATFNAGNIEHLGLANAYNLGGGRIAYFSQGSLQLNIESTVSIPAPAALPAGLALLGLVAIRRRPSA